MKIVLTEKRIKWLIKHDLTLTRLAILLLDGYPMTPADIAHKVKISKRYVEIFIRNNPGYLKRVNVYNPKTRDRKRVGRPPSSFYVLDKKAIALLKNFN